MPRKSPREVTVKELLSGKGLLYAFGSVIADSIEVQQAPIQIGNSAYEGKLRYHGISHNRKFPDKAKTDPFIIDIDFLLTRHAKKFGTETLMIWEVFLGSDNNSPVISQTP